MRRDQGLDQDINYNHVKKSTSTKRIDLNDLIERAQAEKRKDSRTNFLILSSVAVASLIVVLILSF